MTADYNNPDQPTPSTCPNGIFNHSSMYTFNPHPKPSATRKQKQTLAQLIKDVQIHLASSLRCIS